MKVKELLACPSKDHVLPFTKEQMAVDAEMRFYATYSRPDYTHILRTRHHHTFGTVVAKYIVHFTWYKRNSTRFCFARSVQQFDPELVPAVLSIHVKRNRRFLVPRSAEWNDVIGRIKMDMVAWLLKG